MQRSAVCSSIDVESASLWKTERPSRATLTVDQAVEVAATDDRASAHTESVAAGQL